MSVSVASSTIVGVSMPLSSSMICVGVDLYVDDSFDVNDDSDDEMDDGVRCMAKLGVADRRVRLCSLLAGVA